MRNQIQACAADGVLAKCRNWEIVARPPGAGRIRMQPDKALLDVDLSRNTLVDARLRSEQTSPDHSFSYAPKGHERPADVTRPGWSVQLYFRTEMIPSLAEADQPVPTENGVIRGNDDELIVLAGQLAGAWIPERPGPDHTVCAAYAALAVQRLFVHLHKRNSASTPTALVSKRIEAALNYIEEDINGSLTLNSLADAAGISPYHFARTFRKQLGCSPHQYVVERRLDLAKRLLRRTDEPIAGIAHECGFGSQSHMTDVFKRMLKTTPGRVRRAAV